jgi:hypothetical protein
MISTYVKLNKKIPIFFGGGLAPNTQQIRLAMISTYVKLKLKNQEKLGGVGVSPRNILYHLFQNDFYLFKD